MCADDIPAKGADTLAYLSVNDGFVMGRLNNQNAEAITMLVDGNAELTRAIGMGDDASSGGIGTGSHRYALIASDSMVEYLGVDTNRDVVDKISAESGLDKRD